MDIASSTTSALHGMRLVNRRTGEHTGPCPHCQAGTNRYHVWTEPGTDGRPPWRYWCRSCGASGVLGAASHDHAPAPERPLTALPRPVDPCAAHIPFYRLLYELTALWAHGWLMDAANPDPLAYVVKRGVSETTAVHHLLGYALHDPQSLVRYLTEHAPDLMPYAQEAGLLVVDRQGVLRTHWNLCGALIFPTIAEGEIIDLRARKLASHAKARSLTGSPRDRGAIYPFGWDDIGDATTVMLTESGEFKTLLPHSRAAGTHRSTSSCPPSAISPCSRLCKKPAGLQSRGNVNRFLRARKHRRGIEKEVLFIQKAHMSETAHGDGGLRHDDCDENIDAAGL
jgi:hypothetical protein